MKEDALPFEAITGFSFVRQPISVPPDLRSFRKITQLLLVLKLCSYGGRASSLKLQLFNWALGSADSMSRLRDFVETSQREIRMDILHLDPAVNRAIEYAVAAGYMDVENNGKVKIASKGKALIDRVLADDTLLSQERSYLTEVGRRVTEQKLKQTIEGLF